jgi:hypothetical protein
MSGTTKLDSAALRDIAMGQVTSLIERVASQLEVSRPEALDLVCNTINEIIPLPAAGASSDGSLTVPAYRWCLESGSSLLGFWCEACHEVHAHGDPGEYGHRPAVCHDQSSPFLDRGYRLVDFGMVSSRLAVPHLTKQRLLEVSRRLSHCDRLLRNERS